MRTNSKDDLPVSTKNQGKIRIDALSRLALQPSVVYEAWCNQRPGIVIFILEFGDRPIKVGESFSAAFVVGYFDTIEEMQAVNDRYKGHTALSADESGWRLAE
jgi:hypothetical protein